MAFDHLHEADVASTRLGYRENTTCVNDTQYPQHESSQNCGNCRYRCDEAEAEWARCLIFAGMGLVYRGGWCIAYSPCRHDGRRHVGEPAMLRTPAT